VVFHSTPVELGQATTGSGGSFSLTSVIPEGIDIGDHHIVVTASGPGITTTTKSVGVVVLPDFQQAAVVPAAVTPAVKQEQPVETAPFVPQRIPATAPEPEHHKPPTFQPNILTKALSSIGSVLTDPARVASAVQVGLVLLLLAVLPAHLLNATLAEQSERFERRFGFTRRRRPTPHWLVALTEWMSSVPVIGALILTAVTAVLFGFADPTFGFTTASLRLVIASGIGLFMVGYVANALTGAIARARWHIEVAVRIRPWGLILTIVGVALSRMLHFSPGFLIGLILGVAISGKASAGYAWRVVVVRTSIVLSMGILAWIGYSALTLGGEEGGTFWSALLVETLVAITTEGIVALCVELLPLRSLEGSRVYAHSRVLWGVLYFVSLLIFVLAVVPWEGNWQTLGNSFWIWVAALVSFAVLCVGVYIYFRNFAPPLKEDEEEDEDIPLGEQLEENAITESDR
jgi:hypothetical protein